VVCREENQKTITEKFEKGTCRKMHSMAEVGDERKKPLLKGMNADDDAKREIVSESTGNCIGMAGVEFKK